MRRKKSMLALALAVGYLSNTLLQPVLHGEEAVIPVQIEDHTLSPSTLSEDTASSSTITTPASENPITTMPVSHPEEIIEIDGVQYVKLTPIITTKLETRYKSYYSENAIHKHKYLDEDMQNLIKERLTSEVESLSTFNKNNLYEWHGKPAARFVHDELGYNLRVTYEDRDSGKKYLIPIYADDTVYTAPSVDLLYPKNKELCDPNTKTIQNWFKENLVDVSDFVITDRNIKQESLDGKIRYYYDVSVTNDQGESHTAKLRILNRFEDIYDVHSYDNPWNTDYWMGENSKNYELLPYATKDENKTALVFDANRFSAGVDSLTETEKASIKQTLSRIWNNASWGISDMEVLGKGELGGDPVIKLKITDDDGHTHYENLPIVSQETFYMHSFADLSKYDISKLYVGGDFIYVGGNPDVKKIHGQDNIKHWLKRKNVIKENEELGDVEVKTIESSTFSGDRIYKTEITYPVIKNGEIVRRILVNVTKPDEYPGDGSTQIVLSTPIGSGRAVTELDKAEIFRVLNNTYPEIKDIEMLNTGFSVSGHSPYATTTIKVIYAGDKNSEANCGPKPACEINECTKNHEFQNLKIYIYTHERGTFTSVARGSCPPRMYIDAPKPSLDSGSTCAYAKKSSKTGVLDPKDMHFNRTPRTTAIKPLCNTGLEPHDDEDNEPKPGSPSPTCPPTVDYYGNPIGYDYCDSVIKPDKPSPACPPTITTVATYPAPTVSEEPSTPKKPCDSGDCVEVVPGTPSPTPEEETTKPTEPSKPSEPETEASTEATKETEPETTKASKETEAPKPPKPRNPDRVKPTEPTKETEPETVKPTEPVSPSEIERNIPKNSKPSTPIPPATPSKPKITMHKNGEVRGNHRDPVDEKYGEVYESNRPFYVDENGEKVYYTDRTVHTGDERNMRRNMLLMLSAFGLLVLYGTMRFLKKLDVE